MIALFKSHYSIGKSILTLEHPDNCEANGPDSIFDIAKDKLDKIVLVEDSLIGFLQSQKVSKDLGLQLIFGLRISCSHEVDSSKDKSCVHKIILFAKNDKGCVALNKIYSHAFCNNDGVIDFKSLKNMWDENALSMAIPFYDSFIFMNSMHFCNCIPDFSFTSPHFFIENNHLPFDNHIKSKVISYCEKSNFEYSQAKSIYYNKVKDFEAYQTYKCICNRQPGRQASLSNPRLDHFGSDRFCVEAWKEDK